MRRVAVPFSLLLLVATGCATPGDASPAASKTITSVRAPPLVPERPTATEEPTVEPTPAETGVSADEVAAEVAVQMESECTPPRDELLCSVVEFDSITFADGVLSVPTTLDADAAADAAYVCSFFETANMDQSTGALFGIDTVDMLSADGAVIASCESQET